MIGSGDAVQDACGNVAHCFGAEEQIQPSTRMGRGEGSFMRRIHNPTATIMKQRIKLLRAVENIEVAADDELHACPYQLAQFLELPPAYAFLQ